ncbi:GAP1-N1 domain-containing protein [Mucilaginibacter sp. HD30]
MDLNRLNYQIHRYKSGHQLIASTISLARTDQDTVDRLSDISGQVRPGETFEPYFTCYPLPSEKDFVIARTWQDTKAARAGCVLTKSILVPIREWESAADITEIFQLLLASTFDERFPDQNVIDRFRHKRISDGPFEELVEALFLEPRQPIVIFDGNHETEIIMRLYTVFWPNLRRKFASCTFALAPRSVNSRPFDLLFSRTDLRTRFSDWKGRRIEGLKNNRKPARHRWTNNLSFRIFGNDQPVLYDRNENSLLHMVSDANESTLRLSLLWEELITKASEESSPTAILGLLDIINAQQIFSERLYFDLRPLIKRAIDHGMAKLSAEDNWKFFAALLVKHSRKLMGRAMLLDVKNACTVLAQHEPQLAINFILKFDPAPEKIPAVLYASIGDGLAIYARKNGMQISGQVPEKLGLLLLSTSQSYAREIMSAIGDKQTYLNEYLRKYFVSKDQKPVKRAKSNLLQFVRSPSHKDALALILNEPLTFDFFYRSLIKIEENTHLAIREFDQLLLKKSAKFKAFPTLLNFAIIDNEFGKTSELIVNIIQEQPQLFRTFYYNSALSNSVRDQIVNDTLLSNADEIIESFSKDKDLILDIISVLKENKKSNKDLLFRLVLTASLTIQERLEVLVQLTPATINKQAQASLYALLSIAIATRTSWPMLVKIINKLDQFHSEAFADYVLSDRGKNASAELTFELLSACGANIKRSLVNNVDLISDRLSHEISGQANKITLDNWLSLLRTSSNLDKQRRTAVYILEFAFERYTSDPTFLIIPTFPIVYQVFKEGRSLGRVIVSWFFDDWDKCKTIRHDLVDRYLKSDWSRIGLFQVAKKAGITKDVISILSDSKRGRRFITEVIEKSEEASGQVDKALLKQLHKLANR